jgi:hypothetical protein
MLGATETTISPEAAPEAIVIEIEVLLQEFTVIGSAPRVTRLLPCEAPKFEPLIVTWVPIVPVVAETDVMTGAGAAVVLMDTLSKVAVARDEVD